MLSAKQRGLERGNPDRAFFIRIPLRECTDFRAESTDRTKAMDNQDNAPLKVTINGQEYDATEAEELINVGKTTREYEGKYNTTLDKVWPEYGRSQTELSQARKELEEFKAKQAAGTDTNQDRADANAAAQTLGFKPEDLEKAGYVKKDQIDSLVEEKLTRRDEQSRAVKAVLDEADKLSNEIDGKDGRPRFNKRAVMAYASTYGLTLQDAYEDMHEEALKPWKEQQLELQKRKGLQGLKPGGEKQPSEPSMKNDSTFKKALHEALNGAQE